jgi:hypothetical protein
LDPFLFTNFRFGIAATSLISGVVSVSQDNEVARRPWRRWRKWQWWLCGSASCLHREIFCRLLFFLVCPDECGREMEREKGRRKTLCGESGWGRRYISVPWPAIGLHSRALTRLPVAAVQRNTCRVRVYSVQWRYLGGSIGSKAPMPVTMAAIVSVEPTWAFRPGNCCSTNRRMTIAMANAASSRPKESQRCSLSK